jgi:hypothetical protein
MQPFTDADYPGRHEKTKNRGHIRVARRQHVYIATDFRQFVVD